jgi:hypothetical protein
MPKVSAARKQECRERLLSIIKRRTDTMNRFPMSRSEKSDWILLAFAVVFFALALVYSIAERPILGLIHGPACICEECYDRMDAERSEAS